MARASATPTAADIIIIGGGIAGLYAAYKHQDPNDSIIILEKEKTLGGRAGTKQFHGVPIVTGAGIGRLHKDHLLAALMRELNLPIHTWPWHGSLSPGPLRQLQAALTPAALRETFEDYATRVLGGPTEFSRWIADLGYTDLLRANAYDTVKYYGLEDYVTSGNKTRQAFSVPWGELVKRLRDKVLARKNVKIIKDCRATALTLNNRTVKTNKGTFAYNKKLIIATPIDTIRALLPDIPEYKYIEGQPFTRVYAQFEPAAPPIITESKNVTGPLQKMIPMNTDKGVYMIAYNDNKYADYLKRTGRLADTAENRAYYSKLVGNAAGLPAPPLIKHLRAFYFKIGTHYTLPHPYDPVAFRKKLINPKEGVYVVGEAVTEHQGWTEGALETVGAIGAR